MAQMMKVPGRKEQMKGKFHARDRENDLVDTIDMVREIGPMLKELGEISARIARKTRNKKAIEKLRGRAKEITKSLRYCLALRQVTKTLEDQGLDIDKIMGKMDVLDAFYSKFHKDEDQVAMKVEVTGQGGGAILLAPGLSSEDKKMLEDLRANADAEVKRETKRIS